MLFFFKEKPIVITAIISVENSAIHDLAPIKYARECLPSWWKNTPSSKFNWERFDISLTVKSCPGVGLSLQRGLIMPLWSDLAIETQGADYRWRFSDAKTSISYHNNEQSPEFYNDHHIFKINSPWQFISPVDLYVCFPYYLFSSPSPYFSPSGFIPPVLDSCAANAFLMFKRSDQNEQHLIKFGTPLQHIIPFTEKKVIFKSEVVSREEFLKIKSRTSNTNRFFSRGLKNIFDMKNKYKD